MMLARQNLCCERPADGASGTLRTVPQGRRAVLKAALGLGLCFSFFDCAFARGEDPKTDRKSTRLNSSHLVISYAVFCLKKKKNTHIIHHYVTADKVVTHVVNI